MTVRRFSSAFCRLAVAIFIVAACGFAFAQTDFNESTIPPSSPPSRVTRPTETAQSEATDTDQGDEQAQKPTKPANMIPYTVRAGDTVGAIAAMFGITPEALARANRMHVDDELQIDEVLKVPHPFTTEVETLKSQVEQLSVQQQTAVQKADAAQDQIKSLQSQVQELTGDNKDLQSGVQLLPWWRATAGGLGVLAAIMFIVMVGSTFQWWIIRRRFIELTAMTTALSRLDYKYKALFAKAELRLQQLYGRRRGGIPEGQPRPRMPEEMEIERLNEELKQILELHLQRMGARLPGTRRKGWREMLGGGDVGSTVEARSYRR